VRPKASWADSVCRTGRKHKSSARYFSCRRSFPVCVYWCIFHDVCADAGHVSGHQVNMYVLC